MCIRDSLSRHATSMRGAQGEASSRRGARAAAHVRLMCPTWTAPPVSASVSTRSRRARLGPHQTCIPASVRVIDVPDLGRRNHRQYWQHQDMPARALAVHWRG
eukprot:3186279-Rhodomonas_salina.2